MATMQKLADTLEAICGGGVTEIRSMKARTTARDKPQTISGYFTDYELAAREAINLERVTRDGVYMIFNPLPPSLMGRAPNMLLGQAAVTTNDRDVSERRWMFVDVDAVRPTGVSATAEELRYTREVRDAIAKRFAGYGQILACSGNGHHLLLRCSDIDVSGLLASLDAGYSDARIKVDRTVGNLARLTKLYGTESRKGFSWGDRVYRPSEIEEIRPGKTFSGIVTRKC